MDDNHKTILPRMWSTDHIANYMNFTTAPAFRLNPAYPYEDLAELTPVNYPKQIILELLDS
jgi:hypothetical protein